MVFELTDQEGFPSIQRTKFMVDDSGKSIDTLTSRTVEDVLYDKNDSIAIKRKDDIIPEESTSMDLQKHQTAADNLSDVNVSK